MGVLFILASVAPLLSIPFTESVREPDFLTTMAGNESSVIVGAFLEFIMSLAIAFVAIWAYPVLKKQNGGLALSYVGFRLIEGLLLMAATIPLFLLLALSKEFVEIGASTVPYFNTAGDLLLAIREWSSHGFATIVFCLGALTFYFLLYRFKLVPRWLSGWGFIGALLSLASACYAYFSHSLGFSTLSIILDIPIGINEMVLAIWLIAKGFTSPSTDPASENQGVLK